MLDSWKAELPVMPKGLAIVLLVINIFFPGIGTILASALGNECRPFNILVGLLQILTAGIIIGWVWSIWWGLIMVEKSNI